MSTDTPDLPSNPTAALRTVLKWIADSFTTEDVEAIAYINSLPGAAGQRTALGVLGELEKRGVFSHDNVEPLIRLLSNINRHDIVKNAWMEDFRRKCAGLSMSTVDMNRNYLGWNERTTEYYKRYSEITNLIHLLMARTRLATAEERPLQQTLKHMEQNVLDLSLIVYHNLIIHHLPYYCG